MRITLRTPTAIVVEDRAGLLRFFGAFLILFAGFLLYIGLSGDVGIGSRVFPVVLGTTLALGGVAAAALPATLIYAFDREQRLLVITERRLTGSVRRSIPLRDVTDVEMQRSESISSSRSSSPTWRVALVLADGRREPWRSWYDSAYQAKAEAVAAIREFLGVPRIDVALGIVAARRVAAKQTPVALLVLMSCFCLAFLGIGARMAIVDQHRLSSYRPVTAEVLGTSIEYRSDSDGGGSWLPVVLYRYEVGGRSFEASRVTPLTVSAGRRRAERMIARFRPGMPTTAYFDPAAPGDAYLIAERSLFPYLFMAIPAIALLALGFTIATSRRRASSVA